VREFLSGFTTDAKRRQKRPIHDLPQMDTDLRELVYGCSSGSICGLSVGRSFDFRRFEGLRVLHDVFRPGDIGGRH